MDLLAGPLSIPTNTASEVLCHTNKYNYKLVLYVVEKQTGYCLDLNISYDVKDVA
jgi:hypothetical protein